ncbi:DUF1707 SHOCT-like domain-containing protein [Propionicicella superfundia]|uniref:DUF1707 SHOCT-like domain-containing protein n=1 Tax=Propionicicella superfundia TaxID=348582 RepID=UPI000411A1A1|nr:DUF1707 domain-containing protein [Propionicicella superfundia]
MSSFHEPTDVGPAVGGDKPVSEADKQQVLHLLQTAYDDGRLTPDELESRQAGARDAQTFDDLIPLTRDLVPVDQPPTYTVTSPAPETPATPLSQDSESSDTIVAVFGGATRKGNWVVPPKIHITAAFGGAEIDMSRATFTSDVVEVTVFAAFGGVSVMVPAHARVIDRTSGGLFGGMEIQVPHEIDQRLPTIIVKGFALFGGADVKPPKGSNGGGHGASAS